MMGSHAYAHEELVAEMGAALLCGTAGIDAATLQDSSAYLASWIKVLKGDARLAVTAGAQAQKAVDLILGLGEPDAQPDVAA
jgi:antirestriction protein ArdC